MSLDNITGTLAQAFSEVQPDTILHSREIMKERITNPEIRKQWFWTADFPMYRMEDGAPVLYLAGRDNNLIFQNMEEAVQQIRRNGNYAPKPQDVAAVVESARSGSTLRFELPELDTIASNDEWSYFDIATTAFDGLNALQRRIAERVYGEGDDFTKNMRMIADAGISETRIYVLNPDYVREHAGTGAISRASWLSSFLGNSDFYAVDWLIDLDLGCLRGVRRVKAAEGGAQKTGDSYAKAYETLMTHPENVTPEIAIGLLQLITAQQKKVTFITNFLFIVLFSQLTHAFMSNAGLHASLLW